MKRTILPLALAIAAAPAQAQLKSIWDYTLPSSNGNSMRVAVAPDGGVYAMAVDTETENIRITKTDSKGIQQWSKRVSSTQPWNCHIAVDKNGNPYTSISLGGAMTAVSRLNAETGAVVWAETFEANKGGGLAFDPQNNVVYAGKSNLRPYIVKFNPQGQTMFARSVDMAWHGVHSLAIAENGTIFVTTTTTQTENGAIILSPNGTVQANRTWENYVTYQIYNIAYESVAAIDNNGRCYAIESRTDRTGMRIRPIEVNATPAPIEFDDPDGIRAYQYYAKFDSKNRMVLTYGVGDVYNTKIHAKWLELQGSTIKSQKSVTITPDPNFRFNSHYSDVDSYGQAYIAASLQLDGGWTGKNQLYALDADNAAPIWRTDFGPAHELLYPPAVGVGRWGQVACANHLGDRTVELIRGTRQYGLRNVTINGPAFTGGKTVTGTVSMYGDTEDARTITLTSSSVYAKIAPQVTIPAGEIQAPISVDLIPSPIRRAVRIEAKLGGITRNTVFYIEPPVPASVVLFPTTIKGGGSANATTWLNGAAPYGGLEVALATDDLAAATANSLLVERNKLSKSFKVHTLAVSQTKIIKISATANNVTKTAFLTVTP